MRNPAAPSIANTFMCHLEEQILQQSPSNYAVVHVLQNRSEQLPLIRVSEAPFLELSLVFSIFSVE